MTQQAKSLLSQIRERTQKQNGGYMTYHPLMPCPVEVGGRSPLDEMLELYIAARESEDQSKLRSRIEKLEADLKEAKQFSSDRLNKLRDAERARDDAKARREASRDFLLHMLREGDIVCVQHYSEKDRRKIIHIDRDTGEATYVLWSKRQKDWCKTEHTENVENFALTGNRKVIQVERPDDKENTKQRKASAKRK